jgi:hypothetical protein
MASTELQTLGTSSSTAGARCATGDTFENEPRAQTHLDNSDNPEESTRTVNPEGYDRNVVSALR